MRRARWARWAPMSSQRHAGLFHPRLVRERIATLDPALFQRHEKTIGVWLDHLRSGALDETKETSLHGGFLERIFGDVLGYRTMATAHEGRWELVAERTMRSGGSADGAIGFFEKGRDNDRVVAPIELKGASQFLEHARGRSLTPIQQGWDYANKAPESRWIIVSNHRETRLYAKSHGQAAYEVFRLEELADEKGFLRFVALLGRDAILGGPSVDGSPLAEMLLASERTERDVAAFLDVLRVSTRSTPPGKSSARSTSSGAASSSKRSESSVGRTSRPSPAGPSGRRRLFAAEAPPIVGERAQTLALERKIAAPVHAAWASTRATHAPPRGGPTSNTAGVCWQTSPAPPSSGEGRRRERHRAHERASTHHCHSSRPHPPMA